MWGCHRILALYTSVVTVGTWLLVIAAAISLFRSWAVPRSAHNGGKWTPKRVGKTEQLVTLGVVIALAL